MNNPDGAFDFAVIGAGIAGASVAAELARHGSVLLTEMEAQPGYHTTGRSAALFSETYGPAPIRALTRASAPFFETPPEGFADTSLLSPRGVMMVAREDQFGALDTLIGEVAGASAVERLDGAETVKRFPLLRPDYVAASMYDPRSRDIDVNALHQGFLHAFRAGNGQIATNSEVLSLSRENGLWRIEARSGTYIARTIVNAAGAWADHVGAMAGAQRIRLVPKRRTAATIAAPAGTHAEAWPMVVDVEEQFYIKPESGRFLISPADETPSEPCDAQPDEMDIAICVDRIETAFDLQIRRIEYKWAGLRSFVADRCPVAGFDNQAEGFFWLAGQGGYGIQTSPALARLAACLITGRDIDADILDQGLDPGDLSPERLKSV